MKKRVLSILLLVVFIAQFVPAYADSSFSSNPDAIEQAAKSVLMLQVFDADNQMIKTGSGFVAFNNRTIITNHHVIEDADWMMAISDDGYQYMVTKVLVADEEKDIAICSFMSPTDLQPLEFNIDGELKRAENVVAIGSPRGFTNTVSLGNISAIYRDEALIQFTAPISHGSSGGALFDDSGRVIGITSSGFDDAQNLNFAVHISEVEALYKSWNGLEVSFNEFIAISNVTPTPVPTAVPTPEPTSINKPKYVYLEIGATGEEVIRLQEALIDLGYLKGSPTGRYDWDTSQAVILFNQIHFSVIRSGADREMQELLFEGNPKRYEEATPKPTITPHPKGYVALKKGDSGDLVLQLQVQLIHYNYLKGTATGVFDDETEKAVIAFNKQNFSRISKRADVRMQELLFDGVPKKFEETTPNPNEYGALKKGDKGENVRRLQVELIKLGYLDDKPDGIFGTKTEDAVVLFNSTNFGAINHKVATHGTQSLLFEGNPKAYKDPAMALSLGKGGYAEWYDLSNNQLKIHFQVSNVALKKTVKAFELYVYAKDVWGKKIYGDNIYYWTTTKTIAPGKTVYSDYITIPDRSNISEVYCGIHKIAYTDGTTYIESEDNINYFGWIIKTT